MKITAIAILSMLWCTLPITAEEIIDISVKGISGNVKHGAQQDRLEAIMDARRQACEKAGLTISSKTTVENFKTVFDYVESQADAVLMPGFQVIDVGYLQDGTYSVVLIGKVKKGPVEAKDRARFTVLVWLNEKEKFPTDKTVLLDKLYEWFTSFYGEIKINEKPLEGLEADLAEVWLRDSGYYDGRRFFAFTYLLPLGDLTYTQRTPTTDGGVSADDFKIRLRSAKQYIMSIANNNAFYFDQPQAFDGSFKHPREGFSFPADFKKLYPSAK
jgi:hypothetical protein